MCVERLVATGNRNGTGLKTVHVGLHRSGMRREAMKDDENLFVKMVLF